jgi:arginyl-tRNA synthetase
VERFTSFEGDTGPYILYTIVRIKSILNRYMQDGNSPEGGKILPPASEGEKSLMLEIAKFNGVVENAFEEKAPHKICSYIYDLANAFNRFYHETKILAEENKQQQQSWIHMLILVKDVLEGAISLLGFEAPERM